MKAIRSVKISCIKKKMPKIWQTLILFLNAKSIGKKGHSNLPSTGSYKEHISRTKPYFRPGKNNDIVVWKKDKYDIG